LRVFDKSNPILAPEFLFFICAFEFKFNGCDILEALVKSRRLVSATIVCKGDARKRLSRLRVLQDSQYQ
jgi:hypothetical protein